MSREVWAPRDTDDYARVLVDSDYGPEDPVRTYYEVPEKIVAMVRECASHEGQGFAQAVHDLVLERNAARVEIARLRRNSR